MCFDNGNKRCNASGKITIAVTKPTINNCRNARTYKGVDILMIARANTAVDILTILVSSSARPATTQPNVWPPSSLLTLCKLRHSLHSQPAPQRAPPSYSAHCRS